MLGYFDATIQMGKRSILGKIYVSRRGDGLLGWPHQLLLGVTLNQNADPQVQIQEVEVNKNMTEKISEIISEQLGMFKGI